MSKRTDHVEELRAMGDDELADHLRQQRRKLFEVRFQQATGQVENHRQIRLLRGEIARIMTVQIQSAAPVAARGGRQRGAVADKAEAEEEQQ
jgi:large subunit ribosomal protein L29